jgi:UDP-2-acetamido-2-deoxy-ribo-hexuluronate aminotransferase
MQFIDLNAQLERIRPAVDAGIAKVLAHGQFILGPEVTELETRLAEFCGAKHCIGVANGTDALQLALMALGVGPGDEVITPSFSYIAAAEVIVLLGATPVLVDVDAVTFNVDPARIAEAVTARTKAIIPVDLFGQCADYDAIDAIAQSHGLAVISDGAQSFGARQNGRGACSFGTIATTSFFPSKPLGCYGDGGACFTDSDDLAALLRSIRAHGQAERYNHVRLGVNARLDTIQAAVLLAKMDVFDSEITARDRVAARYGTAIAAAGLANQVALPALAPGNTSVWAQYTVRVANRDAVRKAMNDRGVPIAVHYPNSIHNQGAMKGPSILPAGGLPHSERAAAEVLSLPMHPYLSDTDQDRVVAALAAAVRETAA